MESSTADSVPATRKVRPASANWGLVWSILALGAGLVMPWADTSLIGEPQSWYLIEIKGLGWFVLLLLVVSAGLRAADVTGLIDPGPNPMIGRVLSIAGASMAALTLLLAELIGGLGILETVSTLGDAAGRGGVDVSVGLGPWLVGIFSVLALLPDSSWDAVTLEFLGPRRRLAAWLGIVGLALMLTARYDSFVSVSAGDVEGALALARLPLLGPLSLILTVLAATFLAVGYLRSRAFLIAAIAVVSIIGLGALMMGAAGSAATRLDSAWLEERIPAEFAEYDPEVVAGRGWMLAVGGAALAILSSGLGLFVTEPVGRQAGLRRHAPGDAAPESPEPPTWGAASSKELDW